MTGIATQDISARVVLGSSDYRLTDLETSISRWTETDYAKATIVDEDLDEEPEHSQEGYITINGERVLTGFVSEAKAVQKSPYQESGAYEINLLSSNDDVMNTRVTLSITEEPTPISEVVSIVCDEIGVGYEINLVWYTARDVAVDYPIGIEETVTKASDVLDKLAKWANADWWFDQYNVLHFGLPESTVKKLEYVKKDSDFGSIRPPYRGVKVVGDNIASQYSRAYAHIPGAEPVIEERALELDTENGTWSVEEGYTNDPVFDFKDKQIKTDNEASVIADKLIKELRRQVDGGKINVTGREDIQKLDVVELPDALGGQQYFVGKVNHTISDSDGFITKIECESVVPEQDLN